MFNGEQAEMAKSYIDVTSILAFMIANGHEADSESEKNKAVSIFLVQLEETFDCDEEKRAEKEKADKEKAERKAIALKRQSLLSLTAEKSAAVLKLDASIKAIVEAIPEDERSDEERMLLGAPEEVSKSKRKK